MNSERKLKIQEEPNTRLENSPRMKIFNLRVHDNIEKKPIFHLLKYIFIQQENIFFSIANIISLGFNVEKHLIAFL